MSRLAGELSVFVAGKNMGEKEMQAMEIGQKIKQLRIQKGLTLEGDYAGGVFQGRKGRTVGVP